MNTARLGIIAVWLAGLLGCGAVIMGTRFSTDMSALLPPLTQRRHSKSWSGDQLREGVVSRLILLAVEGTDPDTLAELEQGDGAGPAIGRGLRDRQQR